MGDNSSEEEVYRSFYARYGESPKALQWIDYKSAASRYRQLVADLDIRGKSVLDAGCGMGHLLPYLLAKTDDFRYVGVDITKPFVDFAKKQYEPYEFRVADAFADDFKEKFDITLTCGVLNSNVPDWPNKRQAMIEKLFSLAREATAFNMAGSIGTMPHDRKIAYANALAVLEFCASLTPKIIFRSHYHSHDFTVVMFK